MKTKDRVNKNTSTCRCIDKFRYSDQVYHFTESINEHKNAGILVWIYGKSKDKSMETDSQHSTGMGKDYNGARSEGLDFTR